MRREVRGSVVWIAGCFVASLAACTSAAPAGVTTVELGPVASASTSAETTPVARTARPKAEASLIGLTFYGTHSPGISREGCEGCGEPGEFGFASGGRVGGFLPGSDVGFEGTWKQQGDDVLVDAEGYAITFRVADGGKTLVDMRTGSRYVMRASPAL